MAAGRESRTRICFSPATTLFVLLLLTTTSGKVDLTRQQLREMEAVNAKALLKQEIKLTVERHARRQGPRVFQEEPAPANYSHPFHNPNIADEVSFSYQRYREMILVKGGKYWKGTNDPDSNTGEYPLRKASVKSFYLDVFPVINAQYWAFRAKKKFVRSEAETKGWSWVVDMFLSAETRKYYSVPGAVGWAAVKKAHWDAPEGVDSNLENRWRHPVVHMSWYDARSFCNYYGKRLPTEWEWEYAVRAGIENRAYPWGDNWERQRANSWQGKWPNENKKADGYSLTSPVDAYIPQNVAGFYDMIGNVWEWTDTPYVEPLVRQDYQHPTLVLKGGSYVDSVLGNVNAPLRNGQRMGQKQEYTASNVGFRCAKSLTEFDETTTTKAPKKEQRGPVIHRLKRKKDEL